MARAFHFPSADSEAGGTARVVPLKKAENSLMAARVTPSEFRHRTHVTGTNFDIESGCCNLSLSYTYIRM